jgi:hypothetical protein
VLHSHRSVLRGGVGATRSGYAQSAPSQLRVTDPVDQLRHARSVVTWAERNGYPPGFTPAGHDGRLIARARRTLATVPATAPTRPTTAAQNGQGALPALPEGWGWADPPPGHRGRWDAVATALRAAPGRWARLSEAQGAYCQKSLRRLGLEVVTRSAGQGNRATVYARARPAAQAPQRGQPGVLT